MIRLIAIHTHRNIEESEKKKSPPHVGKTKTTTKNEAYLPNVFESETVSCMANNKHETSLGKRGLCFWGKLWQIDIYKENVNILLMKMS